MKKAQTATEYTILFGIALVLVLLGAAMLGKIPVFSGGDNTGVDDFKLTQHKIGVDRYAIFDNSSKLIIRNNFRDTVIVDSMSIENITCSSASFPITIKVCMTNTITCTNINDTTIDAEVTPNIKFNWTDPLIGASYATTGLDS